MLPEPIHGNASWRLAIVHETVVEYAGAAHASYNELRMTPLSTPGQVTLNSHVELHPRAAMWQYTDYWGTRVTAFDLQEPHSALTIRAASTVETTAAPNPASARVKADWATVARRVAMGELAEFVTRTDRTAISTELGQEIRDRIRGADPHEAADEISAWLHGTVSYVPGATGVHTNAQESWEQKSGVCQDFSHIAIAMLRSIGFAVEPAEAQAAIDGDLHRVWIDSDRLHGGGRAGMLPN
ncbi:MAG TPA: transglutaminase family protein [Chloroflexota bacterium]|nr:transglutaminase family protein [Chloroflexota bacterium]